MRHECPRCQEDSTPPQEEPAAHRPEASLGPEGSTMVTGCPGLHSWCFRPIPPADGLVMALETSGLGLSAMVRAGVLTPTPSSDGGANPSDA